MSKKRNAPPDWSYSEESDEQAGIVPEIGQAEAADDETEATAAAETTKDQSALRIRLAQDYGGRLTNEKRIAPGDYYADDLRGFRRADLPEYLVANGHAVWIED